MIVAVEEAGSHGGGRYGIGIDVLLVISWGIQNTQRIAETTREGTRVQYARKRRKTANVKKCAVVVCNQEKGNPVNLEMEMGRR